MNSARAQLQLSDGDRIVFLGDSITQAGAQPGGYVSLVREAIAEQMPDAEIEIIGAGISGHRVPDCQERLERDVLEKSPTHVVIYIGINDVWHSTNGRGTSEEDYENGLIDLIDRIEAAGAQVLLCTPSVIGEKTDGSNTLDQMLDDYCDIGRQVAKQKGVELLDLRERFLQRLREINPEQQAHSLLTTDGVHLNADGNQFVSECILGSFNLDEPERLLRHIVLFQFKDESSDEDVQSVVDAFAALSDSIDAIHDFEMGLNNSPEGLNDGFTHCFVVTFKTEADREVYLPHPEHQAFVELLRPHLEKVLVVDYWTD